MLFGTTSDGPNDLDFFIAEPDDPVELVKLLGKYEFEELKNLQGAPATETYFEDPSIARVFRWSSDNNGLSAGHRPVEVQLIRKERMYLKLKAQELLLKLNVLKNQSLTKNGRKEVWSSAMSFVHSNMRELIDLDNLHPTNKPFFETYKAHYRDYMNYYNS